MHLDFSIVSCMHLDSSFMCLVMYTFRFVTYVSCITCAFSCHLCVFVCIYICHPCVLYTFRFVIYVSYMHLALSPKIVFLLHCNCLFNISGESIIDVSTECRQTGICQTRDCSITQGAVLTM